MAQAALLARSSDYATPPWGEEQQARFINACIEIETSLDPHALLFTLHKIENKFGRDRAGERRWGPRTLDLDLIAYDDVSMRKAGTDAAASPAVRTRLRAGAARRDRARPSHRGTERHGGAGRSYPPRGSSGCPTSVDRNRPLTRKQPFGLAVATWQFPAQQRERRPGAPAE